MFCLVNGQPRDLSECPRKSTLKVLLLEIFKEILGYKKYGTSMKTLFKEVLGYKKYGTSMKTLGGDTN